MSRTVRRVVNPGLGWVPDTDGRDLQFPMSFVLAAEEPMELPVSFYYKTGPILNQGNYPMCVGFSWRQWLTTGIVENTSLNPDGRTIYCEARKRDPWTGDCTTDLKSGTSIRAGAKYLQERGLIGTYVWAWDAETIRRWILSGKGPVIVGTRWYMSMYRPVAGRMVVTPSSGLAGGHAYAITGYSDSNRMFQVTNSWGPYWGTQGKSNMRYQDMQLLMSQQGECVTAVEIDRDIFPTAATQDIIDILENSEADGTIEE